MSAKEICLFFIKLKRIVGLQQKVNVFYANNQLTDEEYTELCGMLTK